MNIKTTSLCVVRAVRRGILLAVLALGMAGAAQAQVIYQQVFGNSTGSYQIPSAVGADWNEWLFGAASSSYAPSVAWTGVGVTNGAGLSSTDVNIGAALPAVTQSVTNGALVSTGANMSMLGYTTALTIDPTAYSQLQFSWLQKSANFAADYTRVIVCVGSKWYMSSTNFMTSSSAVGSETFTYTPTASSWYLLANGATFSKSLIPDNTNVESLVTTPGSDLSGNITGFGLILNSKASNYLYIDSFAVTAVPEPASASLLVLGSITLLGMRLRRTRLTL